MNRLPEDFCGMDVNSPLGGELPVKSLAIQTFHEGLTAVAGTSFDDSTVFFLGTATGHLKKVRKTLNCQFLYNFAIFLIIEVRYKCVFM